LSHDLPPVSYRLLNKYFNWKHLKQIYEKLVGLKKQNVEFYPARIDDAFFNTKYYCIIPPAKIN